MTGPISPGCHVPASERALNTQTPSAIKGNDIKRVEGWEKIAPTHTSVLLLQPIPPAPECKHQCFQCVLLSTCILTNWIFIAGYLSCSLPLSAKNGPGQKCSSGMPKLAGEQARRLNYIRCWSCVMSCFLRTNASIMPQLSQSCGGIPCIPCANCLYNTNGNKTNHIGTKMTRFKALSPEKK